MSIDELKALAEDTDVGLRATAGYVDEDGPLDPVREALGRLVAAVRAVVPVIVVVAAVSAPPAAPAAAARVARPLPGFYARRTPAPGWLHA